MKLRATQPARLETVPEQDRIHLPGELINPPHALILDDFAGRIERQAVQPAESINLIPVFADVAVLKSDLVGAISALARSATPGIEALALHHEFGDARDRLADPARLVRRQLSYAEAVALCVITAIEPSQGHAVSVLDHVALGIFPYQRPGRLNTTA